MLNLFSLKDPVLLLFAWYSRPRKQSLLPHMPYIPYLFIRYVASQARRFKGTAQQIRSDSGRGEGVDSGGKPHYSYMYCFLSCQLFNAIFSSSRPTGVIQATAYKIQKRSLVSQSVFVAQDAPWPDARWQTADQNPVCAGDTENRSRQPWFLDQLGACYDRQFQLL